MWALVRVVLIITNLVVGSLSMTAIVALWSSARSPYVPLLIFSNTLALFFSVHSQYLIIEQWIRESCSDAEEEE